MGIDSVGFQTLEILSKRLKWFMTLLTCAQSDINLYVPNPVAGASVPLRIMIVSSYGSLSGSEGEGLTVALSIF